MRSQKVLALTKYAPLLIMGAIGLGLGLEIMAAAPETAGYDGIVSAADRELVYLDRSQLSQIAPMASSGLLVMHAGSGFDMRQDDGKIVENYGLACLKLQDGSTAARLVRFRSGQVMPVSSPELSKRIYREKPCGSLPEMPAA